MKRPIITPAPLAPAALAQLKEWLGITTAHDDAALTGLLRSALDLCESFTGAMPIEALCEEVLPLSGGWQALAARPVQAVSEVQAIRADGSRFALPVDAYAVDLDADGGARLRADAPTEAVRIAVRFTAGLASGWDTLPEALRHGLLRLAAHQHRAREDSGAAPVPPASVAALWRPWRRMRLA